MLSNIPAIWELVNKDCHGNMTEVIENLQCTALPYKHANHSMIRFLCN